MSKTKSSLYDIYDICASCGHDRSFHSGAGGEAAQGRQPVFRHLFVETIRKPKRSKKTKRSKRRSDTYSKRVSVKLDDFSDELYQYFKRMKLNPKHNFISFTTDMKSDKIIFSFHSRINHHYNSDPLWDDIHCSELILSDTMIVKTECDRIENGKPVKDKSSIGFYKVFVKGFHNLYEYILSIQSNKTDKKDHQLLFDLLLKNQLFLNDRSLMNHNLDVKTLHFKFS